MSALELVAIIGVVFLVALAALLAAAETALTRMSSARAEALEEEGRRGAVTLVRLVDDRERVINPVLFVLLACHLATATIVAVGASSRWGWGGAVAAFAITLVVIYVVAEAIPKTLALADPDRAALRLAPLVRVLAALAPLRWVTTGLLALARPVRPDEADVPADVTEEELLAVAGEAAAAASIEVEEQVLIESIITFGDTVVREVMVPRPDMVTVDCGFRIADALEVVILNGFSRVPVTNESIDDVVGVVHAKDLMRAQRDGSEDLKVETIMRRPRFVPETKRIAELMREMQADKFHLAIVIDEYGGTAGLASLEDLIEEVVGEIVDEFDIEKPMIETLPSGRLRVNGRVPISELETELGVEFPDGDWDTVGGLIFNSLGHLPGVGETLETASHRLLVERLQGRRIARVLIEPVADDRAVADMAVIEER
ncbi:MAG: hemolysin family protein [Acidimicrobiia bacterium]|nr:hemolysin family protein [Acidimicrobiia bacterium]